MSLVWLRRVLATPLQVSVETSDDLAAQVMAASIDRPPRLNPKPARAFQSFPPQQDFEVRAIDLLRKIGELTTPLNVNMARLSASWATRRYFWSIRDPIHPGPSSFALSEDARKMERHQKTLLSDEFGVGFAGLVAEHLLGTTRFIDVDFALANPRRYFGVHAQSRRRPDYLFWGSDTPVYIVECKGSQTTRSTVVGQLRRGMEQLRSIRIPGGATEELVIATHLQDDLTQVFVLDPPGDREPETEGRGTRRPSESIPRRTGERTFEVVDPDAFAEKVSIGTDLALLRWAGQHQTASLLEDRLDLPARDLQLPDAELQTLATEEGEFLGVKVPLAPELGLQEPAVFRGLKTEVLERIRAGDLRTTALGGSMEAHNRVPRTRRRSDDPRLSVGPDGTCFHVGVDM